MYSDPPGPPLDLNGLADDARLTVEVRAVAAGARRRATRDGDRQVDTAHLLHSVLELDPAARDACDAGTGRLARVLGYLVQRSIGYGMRWSGSVEDSGALPALAPALPGWSPAAAAAMRAAVAAARRCGRPQADGIDLLYALAADPDCRAVQVLRAAGVTFATEDGAHRDVHGSGGVAGGAFTGGRSGGFGGRRPCRPGENVSGYLDDGPVAS